MIYAFGEPRRSNIKNYQKYDDNFNAKSGVCYTDKNGKDYTYDDMLMVAGCDEGVADLYKTADGDTLDELCDDSWSFRKCPRCGQWVYSKNSLFSRRDEFICRKCTPLRTNGHVHIENNPYDDDRRFYVRTNLTFRTGLTTLVGCNGIGKSTLLRSVKEYLSHRGTPCVVFDNLSSNGGQRLFDSLMSEASFHSSEEPLVEMAVSAWASSEGERIRASFIRFVNTLIPVLRVYKDYGEIWLLFDALDSGLSVDVIDDMKEYVFNRILSDLCGQMNVYIILSSNSYEMCDGTQCFCVGRSKYVDIDDYGTYKHEILSSVKHKEKRDSVFAVKSEIANRPYDFVFDEKAAEKCEKHVKNFNGLVATMVLEPYKIQLEVSTDDGLETWYRLFRKEDTEYVSVKCDLDLNVGFHIYAKDVEKDMHQYLCELLFKDRKKKL